jgi:hypothetical protein
LEKGVINFSVEPDTILSFRGADVGVVALVWEKTVSWPREFEDPVVVFQRSKIVSNDPLLATET